MRASLMVGARRGPSPATKLSSWPMAKGTMRMSENRIAPSSGKRFKRLQGDLGRGVAVIDQIEETALVGPQRAIFGQIAPGLAHHPDRRRIAPLALEDGQQGLVGLHVGLRA